MYFNTHGYPLSLHAGGRGEGSDFKNVICYMTRFLEYNKYPQKCVIFNNIKFETI